MTADYSEFIAVTNPVGDSGDDRLFGTRFAACDECGAPATKLWMCKTSKSRAVDAGGILGDSMVSRITAFVLFCCDEHHDENSWRFMDETGAASASNRYESDPLVLAVRRASDPLAE